MSYLLEAGPAFSSDKAQILSLLDYLSFAGKDRTQLDRRQSALLPAHADASSQHQGFAMSIRIQAATVDDVDELVLLLDILFSIEQDFNPDAAAQRRGLTMLIADAQRGRVFVARHPTLGVVGMVSAQLVISTAIGAPSAWLEDMVIRESFRGLGLGKALLDAAYDWAVAQGAGRLQLLADAENIPALDFYRHLEWQSTRLFAWKKLLD